MSEANVVLNGLTDIPEPDDHVPVVVSLDEVFGIFHLELVDVPELEDQVVSLAQDGLDFLTELSECVWLCNQRDISELQGLNVSNITELSQAIGDSPWDSDTGVGGKRGPFVRVILQESLREPYSGVSKCVIDQVTWPVIGYLPGERAGEGPVVLKELLLGLRASFSEPCCPEFGNVHAPSVVTSVPVGGEASYHFGYRAGTSGTLPCAL